MNTFQAIEVDYLQPDKTIETVLVKNKKVERIYYVYNYQGWFFRVFDNLLDLMEFFDNKFEPKIIFESESDLDQYFEQISLG